jgi:hypothetical protein
MESVVVYATLAPHRIINARAIIVIGVRLLATLAPKRWLRAWLAPNLVNVVYVTHIIRIGWRIAIPALMRTDCSLGWVATYRPTRIDDNVVAVDASVTLSIKPWQHKAAWIVNW